MLLKVVAVMCHLVMVSPPPFEACEEVVVTDSDQTESLTLIGCMMTAEAPLAKWKSESSIYHGEEWRIAKFKCVSGNYEIKRSG